ncbi:hypothetical protein L8T94_07270, partial [Campylobacter lari]|nr:hypothetical protein [Campylobacter lari]
TDGNANVKYTQINNQSNLNIGIKTANISANAKNNWADAQGLKFSGGENNTLKLDSMTTTATNTSNNLKANALTLENTSLNLKAIVIMAL